MRSALHICDLDERSIRETAQILGLSTAAVKSRINRARKTLRDKLNGSVALQALASRSSARELKRFQRPN